MTPSAERLKAGRQAKLVSSFNEEHPWPPPTRSSLELCRAARLTCGQRVLDGKLPRRDNPDLPPPDGVGLPTILDMLGLR